MGVAKPRGWVPGKIPGTPQSSLGSANKPTVLLFLNPRPAFPFSGRGKLGRVKLEWGAQVFGRAFSAATSNATPRPPRLLPPRPRGGAGVRSPRLRSDYQNMCRGLSSFSVTAIFYVVCHRRREKGLRSRRQIFSLEWFLSGCVGKLDPEIFTENMIGISSLSGNLEDVSRIM